LKMFDSCYARMSESSRIAIYNTSNCGFDRFLTSPIFYKKTLSLLMD
jgi:hypothetical protein